MTPQQNPSEERVLHFGGKWKYAPALETTPVTIPARHQLFIGGKWVEPRTGRWFTSINPATGKPLSEIAAAGADDVADAVVAARRAYDTVWNPMPPRERGKYLYRIARLLQERAREFAILETMDGGKPIKESRDFDLPMAAAHFFYYAGWADKLAYAVPGGNPSSLGVAAQIIPWNFPLLMAAWKIAPALACGNTVVLKPAETTSITALALANLLDEAELPPGVVNIVTGGGDTGRLLAAAKGVDKVAFTGSTAVGRLLAAQIVGTGKGLTLELGGKAAHIICEDAPLDQAVEGAVQGIFFNQGHVCCAGSRLIIQESILDVFLEKLRERIATLRVGNPLDKNTDLGAINSAEQLDRIAGMVDVASGEGLRIWQPSCDLPADGFWFRPTLVENATPSHTIAREEVFGPVACVIPFRTPEEAVARANNTAYGLSAGIWTDKGSKILQLASQLKAGVIWANTYNKFDPSAPFGGVKESGWGREGGLQGLLPYLHRG